MSEPKDKTDYEKAIKYQKELLSNYKLTKNSVGESYHRERTYRGNKIMKALESLHAENAALKKERFWCRPCEGTGKTGAHPDEICSNCSGHGFHDAKRIIK